MELSDTFAEALPAQARVVVAGEMPSDFVLRPEEAESCGQMSAKRLREFMLGRYCARAALTALGVPDDSVPKAASREPVWPSGIVGSISHTQAVGAAVAAHDRDLIGVGVDLEDAKGLKQNIIAMICRPEERARLSATPEPERVAKIIFSAKESIYKCIWPTVRRYVDFQDVEITVDLAAGRYAAVAREASLPANLFPVLRGHYFVRGDLLATTAYIRA